MTHSYCLTLADGSLLAVTADRCRRDGSFMLFETRGPASQRRWSVACAVYKGHVNGIERDRHGPLARISRPGRRNHGGLRLPETASPMTGHPNQREIDELCAGVYLLTETEIHRLSDAWTDGASHRLARWQGLHPDTPAAPDLLRIMLGLPVLVPVYVAQPIRQRAIGALADAFIAAYGRPRLTPALYRTLMRTYWHAVAFTAGASDRQGDPEGDPDA